MQQRFEHVCRVAASIMADGHSVFSPIAHSHPIADYLPPSLRTDFEFWMAEDLPILRFADELQVLTLNGWRESKGIKREMAFAESLGIKTILL